MSLTIAFQTKRWGRVTTTITPHLIWWSEQGQAGDTACPTGSYLVTGTGDCNDVLC